MTEFGQQPGFLHKPLEAPVEAVLEFIVLDADCGVILPIGDITWKELLDRDLALQVVVHRQVGIAKATGAEHSNDLVISDERGSWTECIGDAHCTLEGCIYRFGILREISTHLL